MITKEHNALLTATGPGTPMGDLFRRYWIPALLAEELPEPDCPPVRVSLLGERLVAFRDTQNRLGLVEEFCPHRGISLWFGRNEESGLRCVYHGWKFDVTGQCTEIPSEAAADGYCNKIKLRSYPLVEAGGVVWAYMGPLDQQPAPPAFEWVTLAPEQRFLSKRHQESNYLQALEGGVDSSHVSFLHRGDLNTDPLHRNTAGAKFARATNTVFDVHESTGGLMIGARRSADPGTYYWRLTQWLMPWYTLIPPYSGQALNGHAWVPMDDENCMAWTWTFHPTRALTDVEIQLMKGGAGVHAEMIPGTFEPVANRRNDYFIDRQAQKDGRYYNGVKGLAIQDAAVQESMGAVADRSNEHLVATDAAIIKMRQRLFDSSRAVQRGEEPPGLQPEDQYVRSASFVLPVDASFSATAVDAVKVRAGKEHVAV
jgi:phthalate 4,5-dioxygenase oxygenase subunit